MDYSYSVLALSENQSRQRLVVFLPLKEAI